MASADALARAAQRGDERLQCRFVLRVDRCVARVQGPLDPHEREVFQADLDGAKVVWARAMDPQDTELLRYFHDRDAWLLNADDPSPHLEPYRP